MGKKFWIQEALDHKTKGSLHRQLSVPQKERIPKTLVQAIVKTEIGKKVRNPTETGKRSIKVTKLLKQRANAALNVGYGRYPRKKR